MTPTHVAVPISRVRTDGGTQTRAAVNPDTVVDYTDVLRAGGTLPPVVVFEDGDDLWMADGFHRLEAHLAAGLTEISAEIRHGSKRDALLYSAGANHTHGLRRSNADKRQAIKLLLEDEEWCKRADNWIATACNVSNHLVAAVRADSTWNSPSCPQEQGNSREKQEMRVSKDLKKRPAKAKQISRPQPTPDDGREDGEIVDDEGYTVAARLREHFKVAPAIRSVAAEMTRLAGKLHEIEASKAYRDATQTDRKAYSTMLLTGATMLKDIAPAVVCGTCHGDGCGSCGKKGYLTHGEHTNRKDQ
ncbi:MAG TPA: ParB/RepB/Spo0J family partition protein [Gemmataceae bacterium]|nr:ParB/RepB/Spo0J family partition protein [Gemmataceae bacterium]